jgi:hypothetical protein
MLTHLRQALLIWFITNLTGSVALWLILFKGFIFYQLLMASLIFSIPAVILLIPALYILNFIDGPTKRIAFALISTFGICATVLMLFLAVVPGFGENSAEIGKMLLPYVGAAPVCFITIVELSTVRKIKS